MTLATRHYFEHHAEAFDRLYSRPNTARWLLRPGPVRTREAARAVVTVHPDPTVLDLGCGPGRVAEAVIDAGAAEYVGIDFSPRMLALARERLGGHGSVELVEGDFMDLDVARMFDVVLALGLFDYLEEPLRAATWMHAHCSSTLVASFTRRDLIKSPIRRFHYQRIHGCTLFDYTESAAQDLLAAAGFSTVEFLFQGRRGFIVSAEAR